MSNRTTAILLGLFIVIPIAIILVNRDSNSAMPGQADINAVTAGVSDITPDFTLSKLGGGTIRLSDYRGKKPVVLDFWATWCPNCRRDMPNLNRYYEKYKDQIEVIGINLQEDEGTVGNFIASQGFSFPIVLDPNGEASNLFGIRYTNTHFLISKDGKLLRVIPGDIRETDFQTLL